MACSASRAVTEKDRRSALRLSMNTRQRGWMTSLGFFMAPKIGGAGIPFYENVKYYPIIKLTRKDP